MRSIYCSFIDTTVVRFIVDCIIILYILVLLKKKNMALNQTNKFIHFIKTRVAL